jgi:hypothetical protein
MWVAPLVGAAGGDGEIVPLHHGGHQRGVLAVMLLISDQGRRARPFNAPRRATPHYGGSKP